MGLKDLFKKKDNKEQPSTDVTLEGNSIKIGNIGTINIGSKYVGDSTGSTKGDFYVYEWFIKDTGEVFYVGKGRGNRYKEKHEHAIEAERIRELYDTDVKFVAKNLSEDEALDLETKEMTRILNETNDRLTNRFTPIFASRDNGYSRSPSAPPYQFETASVLYACEIDEHYFNVNHRPFDKVEPQYLSNPSFIDKSQNVEEVKIVYGNNYAKYYKEVMALLEKNGSKIVKTKYAKSVTSWIYSYDDYVQNYEIDEKLAEERIGHTVPVYHLIDVWKFLKEKYGDVETEKPVSVSINPVHNRVPISEIKNKGNWDKGFDDGYDFWEQGEVERKAGNIEKAIELYDKARYNGYLAPALYKSYVMAYKKLNDIDNQIAILDEAIERLDGEIGNSPDVIVKFEEQRRKLIEKLNK